MDSSLNRGDVADVELAMGRLGDEEEVLVRRRNEQRAAMAMSNAFRYDTRLRMRLAVFDV